MATLPRVLIIHSDPGTRGLLRWLFHLHAERAYETADSTETPALIRALRPTVVVMDLHLNGLGDAALLSRIQATDPGLPVVVYTDPTTASHARHLHGVTKVVVHGEHQLNVLLTAVQQAHDGYSCAAPSAPSGAGVAPARPATAGVGLPCAAGRADLLTHLATTTGRR